MRPFFSFVSFCVCVCLFVLSVFHLSERLERPVVVEGQASFWGPSIDRAMFTVFDPGGGRKEGSLIPFVLSILIQGMTAMVSRGVVWTGGGKGMMYDVE